MKLTIQSVFKRAWHHHRFTPRPSQGCHIPMSKSLFSKFGPGSACGLAYGVGPRDIVGSSPEKITSINESYQ